jgi:hypothetical protein
MQHDIIKGQQLQQIEEVTIVGVIKGKKGY